MTAMEASVVWGVVTLMLCVIFMLGAAQTPMQFLVFFGTGAFGAGMGYLVGAWLTPSGGTNPLDQVRNIVAGVLTGVAGTKLLTLWDDLVDAPPGGTPRIMTPPYFVPIVMWLVGFTVSLSAFYTVRSGQSGDVRVTYSPLSDVRILDASGTHIGVLPETVVNFAGAANSPADVTVKWDFQLQEACGPVGDAKLDKARFENEMVGAFNKETGKLKTPSQKTLQEFIGSCSGSQNWSLTATSNQDRSKFFRYDLKFCRTKEDCPLASPSKAPPAAGTPSTSGAGGAAGSPAPTAIQPSSQPGTPAKQETKKSDSVKPAGKKE